MPKTNSHHPQRLTWLLAGLGLLAVVIVLFFLWQRGVSTLPLSTLEVGSPAPNFELKDVHGNTHRLADYKGQTVLVSFLNTQSDPTAATSDPSRSQIVFLKSMYQQYHTARLQVLLIDATFIQTSTQPNLDVLTNFAYDWNLDSIPFLLDNDGSITHRYGVSSAPTTFLIAPDGKVAKRWDGFASAQQLALALQTLGNNPAMPTTQVITSTLEPTLSFPCAATAAQAKFTGLGLARPLSEKIWVVDEGRPWESGRPWKIVWIVFGDDAELHIRAIATNQQTNETLILADDPLAQLPEEQIRGFLGDATTLPKLHALFAPAVLNMPGCFRVDVTITQPGVTEPLYTGQAIIPVR